jgi:hypothetical protein
VNQTDLQVERKMSIAKWALSSLAFLCLTLNTGFAATGLPYVQEGQNVITCSYSVNHTTAVAKKLVQASGASIPGNSSTVAFSPDGLLVYAVEGKEVLAYVFNPHSGLFTAKSMIKALGVGEILPV